MSKTALFAASVAVLTLACGGASTVEDRPDSRLDSLRSLPYVQTVDAEGEAGGTVRFDRERVAPGYRLYASRTSREAFLIDLDGTVVHRWAGRGDAWSGRNHWDAVALRPDGDLVVIDKFHSVARLDRASRRVWQTSIEAHHDVLPVGDDVYVGVREMTKHRGLNVRFPAIAMLDERGALSERWSAYDDLDELRERLDPRDFLDTVLDETTVRDWPRLLSMRAKALVSGRTQFNYFHLNTIQRIPENVLSSDPRFRPGNLLICFRNVHQIAILDPESYEVLWSWGAGVLDGPHQPNFLPGGTILVFDNGRHRGASRVLELDPRTGENVWEYPGEGDPSFFSRGMANAQRLANGNTLINEALRGRVFEVTAEGEVVWEWLNPTLREGKRDAVYRMVHVSPEAVSNWLPPRPIGSDGEKREDGLLEERAANGAADGSSGGTSGAERGRD